jgi:hypothetical protein
MKKYNKLALKILRKLLSESLQNELDYQKEMLNLSHKMIAQVEKEIEIIINPIMEKLINDNN